MSVISPDRRHADRTTTASARALILTGRSCRNALLVLLALMGCFVTQTAGAATTLLQPAREFSAERPLELVLLVTPDGSHAGRVSIPQTISVDIVTTDGLAPRRIALQHDASVPPSISLGAGQYREITYAAAWPKDVRGTVQIAPIGFNAAASVVTLNWASDAPPATAGAGAPIAAPNTASGVAADASAAPAATTSTATAAASASGSASGSTSASATPPAGSPSAAQASSGDQAEGILTSETSRISFNEPVYFAVGSSSGDVTAKFQLSFKYRIFEPADPRSRTLFDNLYFGYTQLSIWDLSAASKPFKDTNFRPSLFYYLPDTGVRATWFSKLGIQTGIEHESNGKAGSDSRSINTAFVRPIFTWDNVVGNRLVVAPKVYYYLDKSDNPDIADFRGYVDLLVKYGNPDGFELATTLRKGMRSSFGSVDAQLTYPLHKLFGAGFGGYVWLGAFSGYGETLIDYNHHSNAVRIGYSITR